MNTVGGKTDVEILETYGEVELNPTGRIRMWCNRSEDNNGFSLSYRTIEAMYVDIQSLMLTCTMVIEDNR